MFADVIVPLPLDSTYSYIIPMGKVVERGMMVVVQFGRSKRKFITGIVAGTHEFENDSVSNFKKIAEILPHRLLMPQMDLLEFVANYYAAPLGEVCYQMLPSLLISRDGEPDGYKPLYANEYNFNPKYYDPFELEALRKSLVKAPKRLEVLEMVLAGKPISQLEYAQRRSLRQAGIIEMKRVAVSRIDTTSKPTAEPYTLTDSQAVANEQLKTELENHQTVLLHGVTSSGKTELYMKAIQRTLTAGKQVLFLVPETCLTQHLYDRLKQFFGKKLGVYHTQCPPEERMETYLHQLSDEPYSVILGTKAALFLPFKRLGLVIVDEEHDTNYKQENHIPYFNARDVALYLAMIHRAKSILGSATPSVESYNNYKSGKFGYVRLEERYGEAKLPQVHVVDLADEQRKKRMNGHFSQLLVTQIKAALAAHHQVILFQNRNGFSPYVQCSKCGFVPKCPHCDVALTYSKERNTLSCPYCGHTQPYNIICDACGSATIEPRGLGVEQLEEETRMLFPFVTVVRHTASQSAKILENFHKGKIDILIGTRSIVKGIDYKNVEVFGIMNVDNMLNHPDFRANERAYQMFVQAAGRTGRHTAEGHLVLQTYHIDNPFLDVFKRGDDREFYEQQLEERKLFSYPPYSRLIKIEVQHFMQTYCLSAANYLQRCMAQLEGIEVIGPVEPKVAYKNGRHVRQLLVKLLPEAKISLVKMQIKYFIDNVEKTEGFEKGVYVIDVDPV